jgi:hypothetical protein
MRRRLVSAVLSLVVGALPGCGDGTDPLPVNGTMHADIVGSSDPWDAEKMLTATMSAGGNLVITGVENSTIQIRLTVYDATVGSFSAAGGDVVPKAEATYSDERTFSYSSSGTRETGTLGGSVLVVITQLSATKAVGTFEFVAIPQRVDLEGTPSYRIRNGTFNVTIR